jgi:hypothetical protein
MLLLFRKIGKTSAQRRNPKGRFMDDRRFDGWTRSLAVAPNRRQVVKRLLGLGAVAAAVAAQEDSQAARRGYSGPPIPPLGCQPQCVGNSCGSNGCGGRCSCRFGCFCLADEARGMGFPNASAVCVADFIAPDGHVCTQDSDCDWAEPGLVCDIPSGLCFHACLS